MPRTLTYPPTDRSMWRRLLRHVHPDTGGDEELFVWCRYLQEHVTGAVVEEAPRQTQQHSTAGDRLDFSEAFAKAQSFAELTRIAVSVADAVGGPYARLLRFLGDCYEASQAHPTLYRQQHHGATYKQLAAIAYKAGMTKQERIQWYRVAESLPLSQRHAGHIIGRLQEKAA